MAPSGLHVAGTLAGRPVELRVASAGARLFSGCRPGHGLGMSLISHPGPRRLWISTPR
jgi:hypothetical protein